MRLLFIHHGQTPHNVSGTLDTGMPGAELTRLGLAQAMAVPGALVSQRVTAVYASPLLRAQQSAAPLAASLGCEVEVVAGLEEISAGDLELRKDAEAVHAYAKCLTRWMRGDLEHQLPGGTDGHHFRSRYDAAVSVIAAKHDLRDTVAVFAHGAAIGVYTAIAADLASDVALELQINNTGLSAFEGDPDSGWKLSRWVSDPLGGTQLMDSSAQDVTSESAEQATQESAREH